MHPRFKGLLFGALGGAIGTAIMSAYMGAFTKLVPHARSAPPEGDEPTISPIGAQFEKGEGSTEAAGRILFEAVSRRKPSRDEKATLSQAVHWAFGISMGALYGVMRPEAAAPDASAGLLFGSAVWLVASELMVPLMGLSPRPTLAPFAGHVEHMTAHLVYGLVTSSVAQGVRGWVVADPEEKHEAPPPPALSEDSRRLQLTQYGAAI